MSSGQHGGWRPGAVLVHPADRTGKFCQAKLTRVSRNISSDCALQARARTCMKLPACFQPSVAAASSNSLQMQAAGMQIPMARISCGLHDASAGRVRESECFMQCACCC